MRWLVPIFVTLICGCNLVQPTPSGTGGSATGSSGAGGSQAASACEPTGSTCATCTSCALNGPCESLYNTCRANDDCMTIDDCFAGCGGDSSCQQGCYAANPGGQAEYQSLLTCVNCQQCPTACAGLCSN